MHKNVKEVQIIAKEYMDTLNKDDEDYQMTLQILEIIDDYDFT